MRQVAIEGPRRATIIDAPTPVAIDDWVVVRVATVPMCTEVRQWQAGTPTTVLGHEAIGVVAEVARPGRVTVGQRVVVQPTWPCGGCPLCASGDYIHCQDGPDFAAYTGSSAGSAGYAEFVLKPDWLCSPVPDDLSETRAALLLCGLGPSFGAFQAIGLAAADTLVVAGLGPVGLGAVVNARHRGARVLAVEGQPWRAALGAELGAEAVLDPADPGTPRRLRELTGGRGAAAAIDCSGQPAAHRLLLDALGRRGRLAFVGECGADTVLHVSPDLIRQGLTLRGSWHYNLGDFPALVDVARRAPGVELLVSHVFPFDRVQDAFAQQATGEAAKVLLRVAD